MKITAIEAIPFRLPARRDFKWAGLAVDLGGFVLVRIRTDEGLVGIGEATPLPDWGGDHGRRSGETLRTVCAVVEDVLAPRLIGQDPTRIEALRVVMSKALKGNSYAKAAIDIALHDLAGKAAGVPLYRLLGGLAREAVPVTHMVGLMAFDEAVAEAVGAVEDGARGMQIKGGEDAERDVALVQEVRRQVGGDITIRLDANQGYGDPRNAISVVRRLTDAGVSMVEQPTSGHREMARVVASVDVPIIADESSWDAREAMELVAAGAADHISIYLAKAGGLAGARRVAAIAEAGSCRCDVNGSIESAIGTAANLAFALATPCVDLGCVIPISAPAGAHPYRIAGHYYEDDIVAEPFPTADGALLPLEGPGLGIEIDEQRLARFRLD
ncbi:enolase C-terminal domain-like protein [Bosea sp. 117]|uniref:mandelate racemase/muconate lactonizing enzyme family protein n=1 Tax=Bosea sp. 117 TaxID=1125973 RepID=UPI0004940F6E|nr:enolase C-terminal domain-like protein [Bosea sp. 117]